MAALRLLLSQARSHGFIKHPSYFHSPLFIGSLRSLSTSSSSSSPSQPDESESNPQPPQPPRRTFETVPIPTISYAVKPEDPSPPEGEPSEAQAQHESPAQPPRQPRGPALATENQEFRRDWTREDVRYVKDAPSLSISPVSYPLRVAPLPEDKVSAEGKDEAAEGEGSMKREEMERERRKLEEYDRLRRRMVRGVEQETVQVPFPTLMKVKQKEKPPILDLTEAIRQVKANAKKKFDETVEAHVRLGVDPKRTELAVRGTMILPHGAPKAVSVAVFAEGVEAEEARAAGADIVGGKELIEQIASGQNKLKVDKCFSTPGMARHLGKIAQYLRKRRLMPDKKLGTLTDDIVGQLEELRRGRVEFKMESKSIVHVGLGKVSYTEQSLRENIGAFMNSLLNAKPAGLKKTSKYAGYVLSVHICSTMGPGFPVSIQSLSKAAEHYKKVHVV